MGMTLDLLQRLFLVIECSYSKVGVDREICRGDQTLFDLNVVIITNMIHKVTECHAKTIIHHIPRTMLFSTHLK